MQLKSKELREDTGLQARQISFREQEKQAADHDALPGKFLFHGNFAAQKSAALLLWLKPASNAAD